MAMLQVIAAEMAGFEFLVFHTHQAAGTASFDDALNRIEGALADGTIANAATS